MTAMLALLAFDTCAHPVGFIRNPRRSIYVTLDRLCRTRLRAVAAEVAKVEMLATAVFHDDVYAVKRLRPPLIGTEIHNREVPSALGGI